MAGSVTVAVDAMGGDHGPSATVPGSISAIDANPALSVILVGDQSAIAPFLEPHLARLGDRIRVRHASQAVEMDEKPSQALRFKKDSSMRVALNLVHSGEAQACVSAGNTGALMATAKYVLKTLPGIDRPAIITSIPSVTGFTRMLDLGANVDSAAEHLVQFAVMGSVLTTCLDGVERPRVGLLNIGEEEIKGNEQVKQAGQLLSSCELNYIGFVEGNQIFDGSVDVVVCDGFVGNVALKTCEGVAKMIGQSLKKAFLSNALTRMAGFFAFPVLRAFKDQIDPRRYNGASLLGLRGIVVKSHGGADVLAFANALAVAVTEVEHAVPKRIEEHLAGLLPERKTM